MIIGLLALLLLNPSEVNGAQPLSTSQQPTSTAQLPAQKSRPGQTLAKILQSGSTNTLGYAVTIYGNGSATVVLNAAANALPSSPAQIQQFPPGTVDASKLQSLLREIGDVSTIPIGWCAKSASFGTRTQISYHGKISGDLQCVRGTPSGTREPLLGNSEELSQLVRNILMRLKVDTHRFVLQQKR